MDQTSDNPAYGSYDPAGPLAHGPNAARPPLSGLAIASLVSSLVGLVACCAFVPSVLGVTFGAIAWGPLRRQEARGRGLALSGIMLGVLGLMAGLALVIAFIQAPDAEPIPGAQVTAAQRAALQGMHVLQSDEKIELLYAEGAWSVKQGGVVITDQRLVQYTPDGTAEEWPLEEIAAIAFEPAANFLDEAYFVIERDGGDLMIFSVWGASGAQTFNHVLMQLATKARQDGGKLPPTTELSLDDAE